MRCENEYGVSFRCFRNYMVGKQEIHSHTALKCLRNINGVLITDVRLVCVKILEKLYMSTFGACICFYTLQRITNRFMQQLDSTNNSNFYTHMYNQSLIKKS